MKEFVTYPSKKKKEREKSGHLQNEGWCNPQKPKRALILPKKKEWAERSSWEKNPRISDCQICQESSLNFVKFYYQYSFTNCFHNIKNTLFSAHIKEIDSFLERKSIASNLNSNLDSTELSPVGGNTSGRKEGIFSNQCASFSIILNQQ